MRLGYHSVSKEAHKQYHMPLNNGIEWSCHLLLLLILKVKVKGRAEAWKV